MPIKNYTTSKTASQTVGEIQTILAKNGARQIMFDYSDDGHISCVCFTIVTSQGIQGVKLPGNTEKMLEVLHRQKIKADYQKAENVAWRNIKDWLDAQLAILETEMVTIDQVMLPYFVNKNGETAYELYQKKMLYLGCGDEGNA